MKIFQALAVFFATVPFLTVDRAQAQSNEVPGAVFALMSSSEFCPSGSVYVDLRTGDFMLYPRLGRANCRNENSMPSVETGTLALGNLHRLRDAVFEATDAGLQRDDCEVNISNGGPESLVITTPSFSDAAPIETGCWSDQANKLHAVMFELFGAQRP